MELNLIEANLQDTSVAVFFHTTPLDSTYLLSSYQEAGMSFSALFVDLPGHGSSEFQEGALDFQATCQQLKQQLEELSVKSVVLIGHGVGGFYAQQFAVSYPEMVQSLILVNAAPNAKYREQMAWNIREKYTKVTKQALDQYRGDTSDKSIRVRFTQSLATYFDPSDHEKAKQLMDSAQTIASQAYVELSRSVLPNADFREQLRKLTVPCHVIASKNDVWPNTASQLFRNDMIHATYHELESGHFPMIDLPDKFWNTVEERLQ